MGQSNVVTIPSTKAQRQFGDLIRRVYAGQEHVIVEKDGLAVVAVISLQEYQALLKSREQLERIYQFQENARSLNAEAERLGITEAHLMDDLEQIRRETYDDLYGKP